METVNQLAYEAQRPALLVLIRHGESARNRAKMSNAYLPDDDESTTVVRGIPDHRIPLTERGRRQALAISSAIRERYGVFDAVYDSGYLRTIQTREAVLASYSAEERRAMKIRTSHLIHERLAGYAYDMSEKEVRLNFPWFPDYWDQFGPFYAVPPGGESQEMACARVYRFNGIIFEQRRGKKVMVVNHGGTIRAFRFCLERWTADEYAERYLRDAPENCSVTTYRFSPKTGRLELECFNDVLWNEVDLVDGK